MNRHLLLLAVATSTALGCKCTAPPPPSITPELVAIPGALIFNACPTKDQSGTTVADVFPDEKKVVIRNNARVGADLSFSIAGAGAAQFKLDPARTPTAISQSSEIEVPVQFSPAASDLFKAQLTVDDGVESTPVLVVDLNGQGTTTGPPGGDPDVLTAQPRIRVFNEDKDAPGQFSECMSGLFCQQVFPDTLHKESSTLQVKISYGGCPALKVTGIELLPVQGQSAVTGFFIDAPGVLPTANAPLLLSQTGTTTEQLITVRFSPEAEATGGNSTHFAILRVHTNDPNIESGDQVKGAFDVSLYGSGVAPDIYSYPTYCEFSDANVPCGYTPKLANEARFQIKNGGTNALKIEKVTFKSSGTATSASGRFTISTNLVGQTIAGLGSVNLDIHHNDMALYVNDIVTVEASVVGAQNPFPQRVSMSLGGGKVPCMTTEPDQQLDFEDPTEELTKKPIRIKNGANCGTLVVDKVVVDTNPFFSVVDPLIMAGEQVAPGAFLDATIQYKKPVSGGQQAAVVRIQTNDPLNPPTEWKPVRLYSKSMLDQVPVAVLKGCKTTDAACLASTTQDPTNSMSVRLQDLTTAELTLQGKGSYDPPDNSTTRIKKFQFRLVNKPSNAMNASLENNGMTGTANSAKLTLDPIATGTYRVTLLVWDDKDQQSPISSVLTISVNQ